MRIAFVTFEFPPHINGGAGVYADLITSGLSSLGHEVTIFTPRFGNEKMDYSHESRKVSPIYVRQSRPMHALQFWMNLPEGIRREERNKGRFDIVHINGISYWFMHRKLTQSPQTITIHHLSRDAARSGDLSYTSRVRDLQGENSPLMAFIERRAVASVDRIIAVSDYTRMRLIDEYHIEPTRVTTIRNGFSHINYSVTDDEINATRRSLCLPDKPLILFVGRIDDPRKGLDILLKAFKNVRSRIDSSLIVVGQGNRRKMEDLQNELGICKDVIYTGFVSDFELRRLYNLCDVYVCPSRLEGFGLTLLDAMNAGKPIVASNVGAIPEIIKDGDNGLLFSRGDYRTLSEKIIEVLTNNKIKNDIIAKGRETLKRFDWHISAEQTVGVYGSSIRK